MNKNNLIGEMFFSSQKIVPKHYFELIGYLQYLQTFAALRKHEKQQTNNTTMSPTANLPTEETHDVPLAEPTEHL